MSYNEKSISERISSESLSEDGVLAYRLTIHETERVFKTNIERGLTASAAKDALALHGPNSLGEGTKISYTKIFMHQVCNAMIMVLIISLIIALAIRDWISGGVIGFVVFINVAVGFIQEYKAEKTMGSLRSLSSPTAMVIRDGEDMTIPAEEVVPGDICIVKVGDTVPADMRLVDSMNFETDEALLTGESMPVAKVHEEIYSDYSIPIPVGDRLNLAYSSSIVSKGRATGIVVSTGLETEIGAIAKSLRGEKSLFREVQNSDPTTPPSSMDKFKAVLFSIGDIIGSFLGTNVGTPLQRKLSLLAIFLFWVAVVFAIIVMAAQKFHVNRQVAIYAICVALSMIPSSLIVVLTITMAVGAQVMVTKNVVVRKLDSLEALGGINDICSDKTGTLTQGKMIAKSVWVPTVGSYAVYDSTNPVDPTMGTIKFVGKSPKDIAEDEETNQFEDVPNPHPERFMDWIKTASLANIATISQTTNEAGELGWKAQGDPTEIAIQVFVTRLNFPRSHFVDEKKYQHLAEFPFDSSIKRMTAVYKDQAGSTTIYTKGAVERVLSCCEYWYGNSGKNEEIKKLTEEDKILIEENMNALSSEGLRVLAFATRAAKEGENFSSRDPVETDLIFLGLVGIYDPPRPETAGSVKQCHKAGVNVHMLTGDHPGTAKAIAQEVGILPKNLYHYAEDIVKVMVMTATEFDALSDEEIDKLPVLPLVIARCAPQTKVRMIDALHRRQAYCAMTGDGVNDSPSLKKADIGIAMGLNGSDVAKDASDIVLSDDNFSSILNAVEEGRRMSSNIQKFILQLLAENVAQALYLMIGLAFMDEAGYSVFPLSPVEVLWIIVVTSCFPAMGLGQEAAADDILTVPPNRNIFTWEVIVDMIVYGVWMAVCCLCNFVIIVWGKGNGDLGVDCNQGLGDTCNLVFEARSSSFATMTWCALLLAWECVDMRRSLFKMHPESETPYTQVFKDLWKNQFLFWSVIGGFFSVFPIVYIPVINDKVFLHKPIGWEWGLAFAFSILFLLGAEAWKWCKRVYLRRKGLMAKAHNPEHDLERNDPFEKYASFSRANTTDIVKAIV